MPDTGPIRSLRSSNPADTGYEPSPSLKKVFSATDAQTLLKDFRATHETPLHRSAFNTVFQAFVADVLDQYTAQYYGDEDPELITDLVTKLTKLSFVIYFYGTRTDTPTPTGIEAMFDDMIDLDSDIFCEKYGIGDFARFAMEAGFAAAQPSNYELLANHLDPTDPEAGRITLDNAIIGGERINARHTNRDQLRRLALLTIAALAGVMASLHAIGFVMDSAVQSLAERLSIEFAPSWLVLAATIAIYAAAFYGAMIRTRTSTRAHLAPPAHPLINACFDAKDRPPSLAYFPAIHWHPVKQEINAPQRFGFTFWRSSLAPRSLYEQRLRRLRFNPLRLRGRAYKAEVLDRFLQSNTSDYP